MRYLTIILFTCAFLNAINAQRDTQSFNQDTLFHQANAAYAEGDYEGALENYHLLLSEIDHPDLHFNIGNCYYRLQYIPQAILHYEKAQKLNPGDEDIVFNITRANQLIKDEIKSSESSALTLTWRKFTRLVSLNAWAIISILFSFFLAGGVILYLLGKNGKEKRRGFSLALIGAFLLFVSTLAGFSARSQMQSEDTAIVFTPKVNVKNEPTRNASEAFILHEGTKVWILETNGTWFKIRIADGNLGWVQSEDVEVI